MTLLSRIMGMMPLFQIVCDFAAFMLLLNSPSLSTAAILAFSVYGLPVLLFRIHNLFFPVREGIFDLSKRVYAPWYGAHQLQLKFIAIPSLEALIRLIPGVYSCWLRAWGSEIGKRVYWTPGVEILDRNLIEIGNDVVIGQEFQAASHVIKPRKRGLMLLVAKPKIGSGAFVGAKVQMAPGSEVKENALVNFGTQISFNSKPRSST